MSEIPLRTYVQQLDNLIDRKNVDEAIAHARHLLSSYPKHLDTYRMLGKALLEKGRHGDAADVFQRVLSVLPDDFIAHVGMAIVREDEANLEAALWHMERAFEAMPSNGAIQQELCRLYGRRDGVVPPKARLTRGALGRMYALGGLFLQAEAELKAALAEDPERIDLQSVLAQVYWFSGQHQAAAQICGALVESLPYSQVANRILRAIFHARGHAADAALYRQRLEALDPYEAFAAPASNGAALSTADQVDAEKILVARLEYVAGMERAGGPDWIASIGARFEEPAAQSAESKPEWMDLASEPAAGYAGTDEGDAGNLPDWLAAQSDASPAEARTSDALPDWLTELTQAGVETAPAPVPDSALPEWLKGATGQLDAVAEPAWLQSEASAFDEPPSTANAAAAFIASSAEDENQLPTETTAPAESAQDLPEWLASAAPAPNLGDDLPDWLKASTGLLPDVPDWTPPGAPEAPATASLTTPPADTTEVAVDLAAAAGTAAPKLPLPGATAGDDAGEEALPDWLQQAAGTDTETPGLPGAEHSAELSFDSAASPTLDQADLADAVASADSELPDWLKALAPADQSDRPPAWEAPTETAAAVPGDFSAGALDALIRGEPEPGGAADGGVPDWLSAAAASSTAADLPPWAQTEAPGATDTVIGFLRSKEPDYKGDEVSAPDTLSLDAVDAQPGGEADIASESDRESGLPDWLNAAAASSTAANLPPWAQTEAPGATDTVVGFLRGKEAPSSDNEVSAPAAGEPSPEAADLAASDLPAGLSDTASAATSDEPLGWLNTGAAEAAREAAGAAQSPEAAQVDDNAAATPRDELPAWLRAPASDDDALDWLQGGSGAEAQPPSMASAEASEPPLSATPTAAPFDPMAAAEAEFLKQAGPDEAGDEVNDDAPALPAWLTALTEDTEENRTAHWEAMADAEFGSAALSDLEEDVIDEPEQTLPEGIPDWLQAVADTAPLPDATAEAGQPKAPEAGEPAEAAPPLAVELPDFLQLASPEAIARANEPVELSDEVDSAGAEEAEAAIAPADLPDWLKALAPESSLETPAPAFDADVMAAAAAGLDLAEAPDWLKSAAPASGSLEAGETPEWLKGSAQPAVSADAGADLSLDDEPDWLKAAAALPAADTPAAVEPPADGEAPARLEAAPPASLPPWAQAEAPGATDTVIDFLRGKDAPDWLTELRASSRAGDEDAPVEAAADSAAAPAEAGPAPETGEPEPPAIAPETNIGALTPNLDEMSADETMRWLESLASQAGAPADELLMGPPAHAPATAEAAPEAHAEAQAMLTDTSAEPDSAGGLPDWLREVEASFEVDSIADTAPHKPADAASPSQLERVAVAAADDMASVAQPDQPEPAVIPADSLDEAAGGDGTVEAGALEATEPVPAEPDVPITPWLDEQAPPVSDDEAPAMAVAAETGLDEASAPAEGDLNVEAMEAAEAMAWLEMLAAQQGASAEELLSAPDERPAEAPAWVAAEQAAMTGAEDADRAAFEPAPAPDWLADLEAAGSDEAPLEPAVLPDWLRPAAEADQESMAEAVQPSTEPEPTVSEAAAGPDLASMDTEAALAWLEGLAAQQGANPEELLTAPEERPAAAPAWVAAEQVTLAEAPAFEESPADLEPTAAEAADAGSEVAPADVQTEEPPVEAETPVESVRATGSLGDPDLARLSRLSERLAATRRAKEAEIEARFAQQRAEQEEARRLVWESMQAKKAAIVAALEPKEQPAPPASPAEPAAPEPAREPVPAPAAPPRRATAPLRPLPDDSLWIPAVPPARVAAVDPYAGQPPDLVFAQARELLAQQEDAAAAAALDHLMQGRQMVDDVIAALEATQGRASAPLLRVLGDAYMRGNQLEQALDTYRRALRQL